MGPRMIDLIPLYDAEKYIGYLQQKHSWQIKNLHDWNFSKDEVPNLFFFETTRKSNVLFNNEL